MGTMMRRASGYPHTFIEWAAAKAELKALGVSLALPLPVGTLAVLPTLALVAVCMSAYPAVAATAAVLVAGQT